MAESRAVGAREPGQVRKEAALSGHLYAQRECSAGARVAVAPDAPTSTEGARSTSSAGAAGMRLRAGPRWPRPAAALITNTEVGGGRGRAPAQRLRSSASALHGRHGP